MKQCFRCGARKPLSEFHRHPRMADGHLGKCKTCACRDVQLNRKKKLARYAAYERIRSLRPERKVQMLKYQRQRRMRNPEKTKTRTATAWAIKTGRLQRLPCEVCGNPKSQAHHEDYSKPLQIRWLCFKHHRELAHGQTVLFDPQ